MKKILSLLFVCGMAVTVMAGVLSPYHLGRVTVRVVDEQGSPVTNATAGIGFSKNIPAGEGWGTRPFSITGQTDTNGIFSAEAEGNPSGSCSARKEGYYPTLGVDYMFTNVVGDRWEPWNPTITVVLRKIGNPVPMYAKRVDIQLPAFNVPVGYDLEKGDWVAPHGKGSVGDLVFEVARRVTSQDDYDATLTVGISRQGDGFKEVTALGPRGSVFRLSAEAPIEGYETNLVVRWGRKPSAGGTYGNVGNDYTPNYSFRIRSEMDDKGNILHALYGKIHGAFRITGVLRDEARLSFTYYLNPTDKDRNLEFDPSRNLFKELKSTEQVKEP